MNKRWIRRGGAMMAILALAMGAYALEADFDPSTYNPDVAEIVTFAVCRTCEGPGFTYAWDFSGDGVTDLETKDPFVTHAFAEEGFYEVGLRIVAAGGRTYEVVKGVFVGSARALGTRTVMVESDGSLLVLIRVDVYAVGAVFIDEQLPRGWMVQVVNAGGAMVNPNAERRMLEVAWLSEYQPGESVSVSYRLIPGPGSSSPSMYGEVQGYFSRARFTAPIAGLVMRSP